MTEQMYVVNQDMEIVKKCKDLDEATNFVMEQPEDAYLEIYSEEEYDRLLEYKS